VAAQRGVRLHLRASDRDEAARRLQLWKHHVTVSGIGEFIRMWRRTLSAWEEQILNYFDDRVTNAFAEGITNKVKVIKRSAYSFRQPDALPFEGPNWCQHLGRAVPPKPHCYRHVVGSARGRLKAEPIHNYGSRGSAG